MGVRIIRGREVARPSTTPLGSSVLDHATVVTSPSGGFGLVNEEGLWPSYNCLDMLVPTPMCPDPVTEMVFETAEWTPGFSFAVHGGVRCKAVGLDKADMDSEVARVFALQEGRAVEEALLLNRFAASGSDSAGVWAAPVDVTPVADIPVAVGLALLEGYAARTYAGVPTIHMPRAAASLLGEKIVWEGDKAYTRLGSKVAFGGGYDVGLDDGVWTMYATGEVYVEKGEEVHISSYVLPGEADNTSDRTSDNTVLALAQRSFRVAVDCFVAQVEVKAF